ncbi:MAG: peptidoglycan DD-metalloendopeptidase family protein, partial [Gemmatimonadaceae bacterium]
MGVPLASAEALLRSATSLDDRRIPAGMEVATRQAATDSVPAEVVLKLSEDRNLHLLRTDTGWTSREERIPWMRDTVAYLGSIESNLYDAIDRAAPALSPSARASLAWGIADILEYRYDMSRDLRGGDVFKVLVERESSPAGGSRIGDVLMLSFTTGNSTTEGVRHASNGGRSRYFDQNGKSLEAAFLRAPLQFRRISSRFGMRKHPILGVWRRHAGTDYAASEGTPIRSIGDGVVTFAGRMGGYGNAIDVRHANGYVSRYGHLRGFAKGMSRGTRVAIGQTVGFVGHTGLATAAHLHFEILVGGRQRDPRVALQRVEGKPLD